MSVYIISFLLVYTPNSFMQCKHNIILYIYRLHTSPERWPGPSRKHPHLLQWRKWTTRCDFGFYSNLTAPSKRNKFLYSTQVLRALCCDILVSCSPFPDEYKSSWCHRTSNVVANVVGNSCLYTTGEKNRSPIRFPFTLP